MARHEEQLDTLKQDAIEDFNQQTIKTAEQKKAIEKKYEDKLKGLKESQMQSRKQIADLERDLASAEERLVID